MRVVYKNCCIENYNTYNTSIHVLYEYRKPSNGCQQLNLGSQATRTVGTIVYTDHCHTALLSTKSKLI